VISILDARDRIGKWIDSTVRPYEIEYQKIDSLRTGMSIEKFRDVLGKSSEEIVRPIGDTGFR
jgi:hypothetical protein